VITEPNCYSLVVSNHRFPSAKPCQGAAPSLYLICMHLFSATLKVANSGGRLRMWSFPRAKSGLAWRVSHQFRRTSSTCTSTRETKAFVYRREHDPLVLLGHAVYNLSSCRHTSTTTSLHINIMYLPCCLETHTDHIILATQHVSRAEHNSAGGNSCFHMGRWLQAIAVLLSIAPPRDVSLRPSRAACCFWGPVLNFEHSIVQPICQFVGPRDRYDDLGCNRDFSSSVSYSQVQFLALDRFRSNT
jgi:hypothetical protein